MSAKSWTGRTGTLVPSSNRTHSHYRCYCFCYDYRAPPPPSPQEPPKRLPQHRKMAPPLRVRPTPHGRRGLPVTKEETPPAGQRAGCDEPREGPPSMRRCFSSPLPLSGMRRRGSERSARPACFGGKVPGAAPVAPLITVTRSLQSCPARIADAPARRPHRPCVQTRCGEGCLKFMC